MTTKKILTTGLLHAAGVTVYVTAVAWLMQNAERIFGQMKNTGGPVAFLLMFVTSAAITGSLVLGRPVLAYWDGRKTEAIKLFLSTVGWLVLITALIFTAQIIV